jgi:hypothetical protein|tara:strand:+ start:1650 stop:1790 length:141 start_codon:yes stop_codon:yes gene_type:complete
MEVIRISWTRVMAMKPEDIKKKVSWYEAQKPQTDLDEFLEGEDESV